jgi:phosphomannomutase
MTAYSKELIIFDLDGTLSESKSAMSPDMVQSFMRLLSQKKVAVISGGGYPQFETQFLRALPTDSANFSNLTLLPASGTRMYAWRGSWCEQYAEHLSPKEKEKAMIALNAALRLAGYQRPERIYGEIIEDRGSQITFSALGQSAPVELKKVWDPDRKKREKIVEILKDKIQEYDVRIGGMTSIDITRRGVNKAYGIHKLEQYLNIPIDNMVFVGDKLMPGGNDYPAKATGIDCIQVTGPDETKGLIDSWLVPS